MSTSSARLTMRPGRVLEYPDRLALSDLLFRDDQSAPPASPRPGPKPSSTVGKYRTAIFDCHQENFLRGETGQIFPFDVIPVRSTPELMAAVRALGHR